jgi:hypothetical protein
VGRRSGGGDDVFFNKVSSASAPSRWQRREACRSGVVLKDFFWGISGSTWSFINDYSFFFVFGTDVVFLTRSVTSVRNQHG